MAGTAQRTDPELWDKVKAEITHGGKGGQPDQWSARKAQLAVAEYKKRGGGYKGEKHGDNHLTQWTEEDWGTKSGKPSGKTHERYLPKAAREKLSATEYDRTTAKKQSDSAKGRQFSRQPGDIAAKVAPTRAPNTSRASGRPQKPSAAQPSKATLMAEARKRQIPGRSRMSRDELARQLQPRQLQQ